ncbi:MAG: arginine--tRNA ligase [Planctomycetaceae bacterium]|nr:arginine--tRNA ligase [Planctomycetaceae bacterium]
MSILELLRQRFDSALQSLTTDTAPLLDMIRPSQDARHGDFQANCAMPLAKQLGRNPRDLAAEIVSQLKLDDLCETPEVAGPGFINLKIRDEWIAARAFEIRGDDRLGVAEAAQPRHVIVDFSSPNVAKPMHVGHLRSSVIGDAICRTLKFAGHKVTSDNHIGDWGTQFGMIIYGYRHFVDEASYRRDAVAELARLYKLVNQLSDYHAAVKSVPELEGRLKQQQTELEQQESSADKSDKQATKKLKALRKGIEDTRSALRSAESKIAEVANDSTLKSLADAHPEIARLARQETSKLHAGDSANQKLWDEFLPACLEALNRIYEQLDIHFDLTLGESYYNPMLAGVVSDLAEKGLARDSDGAVCVFIEGNAAPFIVQKSDGAFTYATTDLATIQYRVDTLKADEILYVVDKRQSEHFSLLFSTVDLWRPGTVKCQHVSFGTVMGDDGKPFKTRSGDNVGLESLIEEAVSRARLIVNENDDRRETPVLSDDERQRVARIVGTGGIKYADLHHNRDSDYVFDWDKMLATSGDTATYMQYAYARICGIFRELEVSRDSIRHSKSPVILSTPEERALALQLIQLDMAVEAVLADYRPNQLTSWLFEAAGKFSSFYSACSVKNAESEELRQSRLILCDLMARAIATGLSLLGIETVEVM